MRYLEKYGYVTLEFPSGAKWDYTFGSKIIGVEGARYCDYEVHFSEEYLRQFNAGTLDKHLANDIDKWLSRIESGCVREKGKIVMISTPVRDVQPEWVREYNCVWGCNTASERELAWKDTQKIIKMLKPKSTPFLDFIKLNNQLNKLDDLIIEYNKNKLSDEFFQFDIIKLNQNN